MIAAPSGHRAASRARTAFTLWEMTIVTAIVAVAASLAAPALVSFGNERPPGAADKLVSLLHAARQTAITSNAMVTVRIDPATFRFQIDTTSTVGAGVLATGKLDLDPSQTLVSDAPRLRYIFSPTGATFADTVIVRGGGRPVWVGVDAWSGVAYVEPR
jgi:prepilin-type N-terminal cleavage/methylation domain-containing protein